MFMINGETLTAEEMAALTIKDLRARKKKKRVPVQNLADAYIIENTLRVKRIRSMQKRFR